MPRRTTKESATGPLAELCTPCGTQGGLLGNHSSPHAAYKRAFPLTPHSDMPLLPHQTTTLEGMTLKNKQPTKHINGFCKGYEVEVL